MADPLTPDRFRALADAFGGVVARWPEPEQAAARMAAAEPWARAILAEATALDTALDRWRVPAPSSDLAGRIVAAAARPAWRRRWRRARWWWSGLGAAAALAGAATGATVAAAITPPVASADVGTAFGDLASDGAAS